MATTVDGYLDEVAKRLPKALAAGVLDAANVATRHLKEAVHDLHTRGRGGLARSYSPRFIGRSGKDVSAGALSALVYAGIQDRGGTIRPRTVRNLAVPLRNLPVGKWPRDFAKDELTFIQKKGKAPILAKVSKTGKVTPYFVLKRSVRITGSGYIGKAFRDAESEIAEVMANATLQTFAATTLTGEG